jgi:hypothetical protein
MACLLKLHSSEWHYHHLDTKPGYWYFFRKKTIQIFKKKEGIKISKKYFPQRIGGLITSQPTMIIG